MANRPNPKMPLYGGRNGNGVVFALNNRGSSWTLDVLHEFNGQPDGVYPQSGVVVGPNAALYGTTERRRHQRAWNGL